MLRAMAMVPRTFWERAGNTVCHGLTIVATAISQTPDQRGTTSGQSLPGGQIAFVNVDNCGRYQELKRPASRKRACGITAIRQRISVGLGRVETEVSRPRGCADRRLAFQRGEKDD